MQHSWELAGHWAGLLSLAVLPYYAMAMVIFQFESSTTTESRCVTRLQVCPRSPPRTSLQTTSVKHLSTINTSLRVARMTALLLGFLISAFTLPSCNALIDNGRPQTRSINEWMLGCFGTQRLSSGPSVFHCASQIQLAVGHINSLSSAEVS